MKMQRLERKLSEDTIDDDRGNADEHSKDNLKDVMDWYKFSERLLNQGAALQLQIAETENDVITSQLED